MSYSLPEMRQLPGHHHHHHHHLQQHQQSPPGASSSDTMTSSRKLPELSRTLPDLHMRAAAAAAVASAGHVGATSSHIGGMLPELTSRVLPEMTSTPASRDAGDAPPLHVHDRDLAADMHLAAAHLAANLQIPPQTQPQLPQQQQLQQLQHLQQMPLTSLSLPPPPPPPMSGQPHHQNNNNSTTNNNNNNNNGNGSNVIQHNGSSLPESADNEQIMPIKNEMDLQTYSDNIGY